MELLCITGVEDKLVQTLFTVLMVLLKTLLAYILKVFIAWVSVVDCFHNIDKFWNPNSRNSKYDVALQIDLMT